MTDSKLVLIFHVYILKKFETAKRIMSGRLAGKAAIITGGASGIGRGICQVFAREGASVAVLDVNSTGIKETLSLMLSNHGNKHCSIKCDVTSPEQTRQSIISSQELLGKQPSILVNNAGIIREGFLTDLTEKMFDDVIDVNLKAVFLMCQGFVQHLQGSTSHGSIINISSIAGKAAMGKHSNYAASKAGVIGLTKTIALEYGKFNIRTNAVLPGLVQTALEEDVSKKVVDALRRMIPMKRFGTPEEIANACLFLASDESSYVNGACLEVTGGLAA